MVKYVTDVPSVLLQGCGRCKEQLGCWCFSPSVRRPGTNGQWCVLCQRKYTNAWASNRKKSKPRVYFNCEGPGCDNSLLHLNKDAKYCSSNCKDRAFHKNRREQRRSYNRLRKYNITQEQFEDLWRAQNGECAICTREFEDGDKRSVHIDHDHQCCPAGSSCGECIRGLLCMNCNLLLGYAGDSIDILLIAIDYLNGS